MKKSSVSQLGIVGLWILPILFAAAACNPIGDFAGGPKKEIGKDTDVRKPAPKPGEDERAEDPIMTSGTYLTCEEEPGGSEQSLKIGCDLRSRSSQNIVALEYYFKNWTWNIDSPNAGAEGVSVTRSNEPGSFHVTFVFSGQSRTDLVAVARVARVIFKGLSKLAGKDSPEISSDAVIGDIASLQGSGPGVLSSTSNPLPIPSALPQTNSTPPQTTSTPLPTPPVIPTPVAQPVVQSTTPPAENPVVQSTSLPQTQPLNQPVNQPVNQSVPPVGQNSPPGNLVVEGRLAEGTGSPQVMVRFSDTKGISNLRVPNTTANVIGEGTATTSFSAAVTITFTRDGKSCSYNGPIGSEPQRLITVCGE